MPASTLINETIAWMLDPSALINTNSINYTWVVDTLLPKLNLNEVESDMPIVSKQDISKLWEDPSTGCIYKLRLYYSYEDGTEVKIKIIPQTKLSTGEFVDSDIVNGNTGRLIPKIYGPFRKYLILSTEAAAEFVFIVRRPQAYLKLAFNRFRSSFFNANANAISNHKVWFKFLDNLHDNLHEIILTILEAELIHRQAHRKVIGNLVTSYSRA